MIPFEILGEMGEQFLRGLAIIAIVALVVGIVWALRPLFRGGHALLERHRKAEPRSEPFFVPRFYYTMSETDGDWAV